MTNFPFIFKLDASYNCYSFSLSVQRVEDMDGNLKVAIVRSGKNESSFPFFLL